MARIVLAEDDSSMREFLALALERAGHSVSAHADGLDALNTLRNAGPHDLLLADIVMPGMDGIELSQKAGDCQPGIKVMFITGFAAVAMGNQPEDSQAHILSKPFHLKDLVDQIEDVLAA